MRKIRPLKATAAEIALNAGVPIAIVRGLLFGIRKHFVCFGCLFELLLCRLVSGIAIGMVFQRLLAVRPFDRAVAGVPLEAQYFVIVPFGHSIPQFFRVLRARLTDDDARVADYLVVEFVALLHLLNDRTRSVLVVWDLR